MVSFNATVRQVTDRNVLTKKNRFPPKAPISPTAFTPVYEDALAFYYLLLHKKAT